MLVILLHNHFTDSNINKRFHQYPLCQPRKIPETSKSTTRKPPISNLLYRNAMTSDPLCHKEKRLFGYIPKKQNNHSFQFPISTLKTQKALV
jgi:hypothetical protein